MVNLTRIYTRTGDGGTTRLSDMSEVDKTDLRVACYGEVDEANSAIGIALAVGGMSEQITAVLRLIQNELFDVGADLSTPVVADPEFPPLRITAASVDRLERWCDEFSAGLPNLRSFVMPTGTPAAAHLHLARTITRRAERAAWTAAETLGTEPGTRRDTERPGGLNPVAITYLNRLSDLLFILTRVINTADPDTDHEVLWVPGGERPAPEPAPDPIPTAPPVPTTPPAPTPIPEEDQL